MIVVLFKADPAEGGAEAYLNLAAGLGPVVAQAEGLLSIERFRSLSTPGRLLSLSTWRDEAAVAAWRSQPDHRAAQAAGRAGLFADYRLTVARAIRDYGPQDRRQAPGG